MYLTMTVIDLSRAGRADVVVDAAPESTVDDLAGRLGELMRGPGGSRRPVLYVDGTLVDPRLRLSVAPIRDGSVVSLDDPAGSASTGPDGLLDLHVTGGPDAGRVYRLAPGRVLVGSGARAGIRVGDPHLPPEAFELAVSATGGVTLSASVPARVDGERVTGPLDLAPGAQLAVGGSLFAVAVAARADAVLHPATDRAGLDFNRPPRVRPAGPPRRFRLPRRPVRPEAGPVPVLAALAPLVFAVGAAVLFGRLAFLFLAMLSPVVLLGNYWLDRRRGRASYRAQLAAYERRAAEVAAAADRALAAEGAHRRRCFPDPAAILLTATGPGARLWERRRTDDDALLLRVGTGEVASGIRVEDPDDEDPRPERRLRDSPVVVPLRECGVLGVAGPGGDALVRWLVVQLAVLHSPSELSIRVLTAPAANRHDEDWNWVRWLPHVRPSGGGPARVLVGNDTGSLTRRIAELTAELSARQAATPGGSPDLRPDIVMVLDGAYHLRTMPGLVPLLRHGPAVGIHAVCLEAVERGLPAECRAVVTINGDGVSVRRAGHEPADHVRPELVTPQWCARVARVLAPVRDISGKGGEARLPGAARLLDVLGLEPPTVQRVAAGWAGGGRSTAAVIGVGADGPSTVDLRRDGPHGLIAGTTGSGKSELLQTLIAALAVANRPDAMNFVLVDYKGGSAFAACARLPHTVGLVTDLDGHLTARALESLGAELRRREHLLLNAGTKDIDDYAQRCDAGADLPPLPRLVIVIDEFASLVAELPDFVTGLVDIARRGRSLGVHLLLATQRPAGVVTADIRANTNLRIALRVTDPAESTDVVDTPDAAAISTETPGRCYVRSGASQPTPVQAARVGGRRPASTSDGPPPPRVHAVPWPSLGHEPPVGPAASPEAPPPTETDLGALVAAVTAAARVTGVPRPAGPWLPPLPDTVPLDDLDGPATDDLTVPFGLTDLPAMQRRSPLSLDLAGGGHVAVVGSAQTGRSTTLRTIAGSLARSVDPADAHLYVIDCGANAMLPLVALPHCGAVVGRDQTDRLDRLLGRLAAEVARRQQLLAEAGHAGLAEQRDRADVEERLPWLLLMLDRWEGFVAAYGEYDYGRLVDAFVRLLRDGQSVGVRAVVAGDRTVLGGQISAVFERRLVLRMAEPADYGYAGITERQVPAAMPPGRVLEPVAGGAPLQESQVALLAEDPAGTAQVAALQRLARESLARHGPGRPLRVDPLPARITAREALGLSGRPAPALWALVGAGGDDLAATGVDLVAEGPGFTVAGPARSGRSTALLTIARSLLDHDVPVLVVAPRRSPLRALSNGAPGGASDHASGGAPDRAPGRAPDRAPGRVLGVLDGDADGADLAAATGGHDRFAVVVDDAELLRDTDLDDALSDAVRAARDREQAVVVAGTIDDLKSAYRGFLAEVLRSRSGLLLGVRAPDDGDVLGIRLPRDGTGGPTGRGVLVRLGTAVPVQVALPDDPGRSDG